jgi:quercetin dioxygenase-like cupin family protein
MPASCGTVPESEEVKELRRGSMTRRAFAVCFGILVLLSIVAISGGPVEVARRTAGQAATPNATPAAATPGTIREVLATGQPPSAPGQTLDLVRYTIPPGTTLAVHVHPGMQIAWVASGELTYHVLKREVQIGRAANTSAGSPGAPETLAAGESTVLEPGDWVAEVPGAVHYGENLGTEPLVLWAATLLETGQPPAIPVNDEGTPIA